MKRKTLLLTSLMALFIVGLNVVAHSQEKPYPHGAVQMIVAYPPGGGADVFYRLLTEELKRLWNVPVNVINKAGASGSLAAIDVAKANKDGSTVLGIMSGLLASMTVGNPKGGANLLRDFDPLVIYYSYSPGVIAVRSDSSFKTLEDLVNYARQNPGKLNCQLGSVGTPLHLDMLLLRREAKIDFAYLHSPGSTESIVNLLGGHVDFILASEASVRSYITAGKIRALVIEGKSIAFPDLPTYAEKGYPNINIVGTLGVYGPKGLPANVIAAWENAAAAALKSPAYMEAVKKLGYQMNVITGRERLEKFSKEEIERYSRFTPEELGWK